MRALRLVLAILAPLVSSACLVVSLHPVYEPETIAFDPTLVGTWTAADEEGLSLTFERGEWHSYHVTIGQGDDSIRASGRLTRVGSVLYLNLTPLDGTDLPALVLPVHVWYRVEIGEAGLTLAEVNYEQLERHAREGTSDLSMALDARAHVVITASTAEIRRWLAAHAADEAVFSPPVAFTRR